MPAMTLLTAPFSAYRRMLLASLLAVGAGCEQADPPRTPLGCEVVDSGRVSVQAFGAEGTPQGGLTASQTLCELVTWSREGIGVYQVKSLETGTGLVQQEPNGPGVQESFGYAELQQVDAWTAGAPKQLSLRVWGCGVDVCPVQMKVGETVVVFQDLAAWNNEGYHNTAAIFLWHEGANGAWSNGELFTNTPVKLAELKAQVQTLAAAVAKGEVCPFDVQPDNKPVHEADASEPTYSDAEIALECVECEPKPDTEPADIGK